MNVVSQTVMLDVVQLLAVLTTWILSTLGFSQSSIFWKFATPELGI